MCLEIGLFLSLKESFRNSATKQHCQMSYHFITRKNSLYCRLIYAVCNVTTEVAIRCIILHKGGADLKVHLMIGSSVKLHKQLSLKD